MQEQLRETLEEYARMEIDTLKERKALRRSEDEMKQIDRQRKEQEKEAAERKQALLVRKGGSCWLLYCCEDC